MGPRLGRVEYAGLWSMMVAACNASMGPRLGRVEYVIGPAKLNGTKSLQWGHA